MSKQLWSVYKVEADRTEVFIKKVKKTPEELCLMIDEYARKNITILVRKEKVNARVSQPQVVLYLVPLVLLVQFSMDLLGLQEATTD